MNVVILVGRIMFCAIFFASALGHFTQTTYMTGYVESKGIKPARAAVLLSGAWNLVGAALLAVGVWADLGALMLFVFLLPTAFIMHAFWREQDQQAKAAEQLHFNKDISLAGGALALFGFLAAFGAKADFQLVGPLFSSLA